MLCCDDFDQKICHRIQQEIDDKCAKHYKGADIVWLCIERRALLGDHEGAVACARRLKVPAESKFDRVFIYYQASPIEGGDYRAIDLLDHQH